MRRKSFLGILIFVAAILLSYFAYYRVKNFLVHREGKYISPELKGETVSMHMDNFRLEESDGANPDWVLKSDEAQMYKEEGYILLTSVNLVVYGDSVEDDTYIVTSERGKYLIKDDKISLAGKVDIKTPNRYSFATDAVLYWASDKKLTTNLPVVVKGPPDSVTPLYIEGVGVEGDVGSGDFRIEKDVSTMMGGNLKIKSARARFNTGSDDVIFEKNVSAVKDDLNIKGDKLFVTYDKRGELKDIDVDGNVILKIDDKVAFCNHAFIAGGSSKVILTGNPEFHVGDDIMVGKKIVFFTDSDEVYVSKVKGEVTEGGYKR